MLSKLRAICILSTQVQQVSFPSVLIVYPPTTTQDLNDEVFTFTKNAPLSPTKKTKRTVGYYTHDHEETEDVSGIDLKRMRIDGEEV